MESQMPGNGNKNVSFICFGGLDWWYHNRAHMDMQLMRRFSRIGTTLYVNSIVMQKPTLKRYTGGGKSLILKLVRKTKSMLRGLSESGAGFWVYSPFHLPLYRPGWARSSNELILRCQIHHVARKLGLVNPVLCVVCPPACRIALKLRTGLLVYLRTDRYEEYPNTDSDIIRIDDRKLKTSADLTVFVSKMLFDEEASECKRAFYLDHGVDYEMFAAAEQDPYEPEDIADVPKPIVGYFGTIRDHAFDMPFMEAVVDLLPQVSFVFVGDSCSNTVGLQSKQNVWLLGRKPYDQIPHYGKCFDVAIMPWCQNRWIEACNPIKLKEYFALGKPVVSTPFPELQKYPDLVLVAKSPEEFAGCIKKALAEDDQEQIASRRKKVEKDSWDNKAQVLIEELLGSQKPTNGE